MEAALLGGQQLAKGAGAELHLLYVMQTDALHFQQARSEVERQALELGAVAEIVSLAPGDLFYVSRPIIRQLSGLAQALPCVASRGRHGLTASVLGSVTADLLVHGEGPILVFGPHAAAPDRFTRVVACTDGSHLAEKVLPAASGLARDVGVPLWIVEVQEPDGSPPADTIEASTVEALAACARVDGLDVEWEVLHGARPAPAIVEFAQQEPGTIIAMATHGRGAAEALLGSVAQDVIRRSTSPVLLLHPGRDL